MFGHRRPNPSALILALHGGQETGTGASRRFGLAYLRVRGLAAQIARTGQRHGVGMWMLRYRYRGWNGPSRDPVHDAIWALELANRTYPGVPVVLVGHSMGARAALWVAGQANVTAVCALAPWIVATDPIDQLTGREVLMAHGDRDRVTDPASSFDFAQRLRAAGGRVCRFELAGGDHAMVRQHRAWTELARRFVLGASGVIPGDPGLAAAFDEPPPGGLRVPVAAVLRAGPAGPT